jgi:hypothetical protein
MRKNQSKYKNEEYVNTLIQNVLKFENITVNQIVDGYGYFTCNEHGEFKKRLDHIQEIKHNPCPKCSRKIYSKIAGSSNSKKHTIEEYVDTDIFIPLTEYKNHTTKMQFLCTIHNQQFSATPTRCFGCDICKKDHHYKWEVDWRHIDQEEIIRRCKAIHPQYDYSKVKYINATTPIEIICPIHGSFWQTYANHTHKTHPQDCPACSHNRRQSKLALKVKTLLDDLNIDYTTEQSFDWLRDKGKMYLDYYIPKYDLGIEVQGLQHFMYLPNIFHTSMEDFNDKKRHDELKYNLCISHNINMLYFADFKDRKQIPVDYYTTVITDLIELQEKIKSFE